MCGHMIFVAMGCDREKCAWRDVDLVCRGITGPRTQDSDPDPPTGKTWCLDVKPAAGGGGDTDLGTLGFVERRAADGGADKDGAQGSAAAVMAGTVCNPGCTRLESTWVGSEDF